MKIILKLSLFVLIAAALVGCSAPTSTSSSTQNTQGAADLNLASTTLVLQAENAAFSGGSVSTSVSGYTGTGYVAMSGTSGSYVEWTFTANSTASASIKFYYTSAVTASYNITVNGGSSYSKSFSSNSSWTSASKSFSLTAGTVKFRITAAATTASGIGIDRIEVTGDVTASGTTSSSTTSSAVSSSSSSSKSSSSSSSSSSSKSSSSSSTTSSAVSSAAGDITVSNASQLSSAITTIAAGKTIWLNDGTYSYSSPLIIAESNSGSSGSMKYIKAKNKGKAIIDFSGESVSDSNRGVILAGSYWYFYGVQIQKAGDNGMLLAGHYNTIDNCIFYANSDSGCQISRYNTSYTSISQWPHNNTVSNCESYGNYDVGNGGENADGFAAKLTCGNNNVFSNCYSHHNSDDGWDLYTKTDTGAIGVVTFTSDKAEYNGYQTNGSKTSNGDGNGFKLGDDAASVAHKLTNCVANYNLGYGYTGNGNPAKFVVSNCTGTGNVKGLADRMNGSM